jgi:imidazolonepropionase-like amidohydrolase
VGALAKGLRADFVYWTGDPLQLSSRVLVVFSGGEIVFDRRGKE